MSTPDWYEQDDLNYSRRKPFTCRFPGKCCMAGPHTEDECHTAAMADEQAASVHLWLADELREDA